MEFYHPYSKYSAGISAGNPGGISKIFKKIEKAKKITNAVNHLFEILKIMERQSHQSIVRKKIHKNTYLVSLAFELPPKFAAL